MSEIAFILIKESNGPLIKATARSKGVEITWWVTNPPFPLPERKVPPLY